MVCSRLLRNSHLIAIQVITDPSGKQTKGKITSYTASPFGQSSASASTAPNGDLNITVTASRTLRIASEIISGSGKKTEVVWSQALSYSNTQFYLDDLNVQNMVQQSKGASLSTHNGVVVTSDAFEFPTEIDFTGLPTGCKPSLSN